MPPLAVPSASRAGVSGSRRGSEPEPRCRPLTDRPSAPSVRNSSGGGGRRSPAGRHPARRDGTIPQPTAAAGPSPNRGTSSAGVRVRRPGPLPASRCAGLGLRRRPAPGTGELMGEGLGKPPLASGLPRRSGAPGGGPHLGRARHVPSQWKHQPPPGVLRAPMVPTVWRRTRQGGGEDGAGLVGGATA